MFSEKAFYAYGDKLGFLNFSDKKVETLVLNQKEFAQGFRSLFNLAWDRVAIKPSSKEEKVALNGK